MKLAKATGCAICDGPLGEQLRICARCLLEHFWLCACCNLMIAKSEDGVDTHQCEGHASDFDPTITAGRYVFPASFDISDDEIPF